MNVEDSCWETWSSEKQETVSKNLVPKGISIIGCIRRAVKGVQLSFSRVISLSDLLKWEIQITFFTWLWKNLQPMSGSKSNHSEYILLAISWRVWLEHTNHPARRTMITMVGKENVNLLHILQLPGHKNLKPIESYPAVFEEQQKMFFFD